MDNLQALDKLLQEFQELKTTSNTKKIASMTSLLTESERQKPLFYAERTDQFNIFEILGIASYEIY